MHLNRIMLFILLLLAACQPATPIPSVSPSALPSATPSVVPSPTPANCPTGDHAEELTSGGQVRQYLLHIPAAYQPEKPTALVLGFHGMDSSSVEFESYSGFSATANIEGFIVVYPQALGEHPTWNTAAGPDNPDIQFVRDLIEELASRCNIDSNRIYASGHSNGGGMVNRLACDLSDRIAAIGPVSGAYEESQDCSPEHPVAILGVHGTEDPFVPYEGSPDAEYPLMGIPQWAAAWVERNGCDSQPANIDPNDLVAGEQWSNCTEQSDVVLYTITGAGHGWPRAFDTAQVIWDFFSQHSLSSP